MTWSIAAKKLSQYQEFVNYTDLFGVETAQRMFRSVAGLGRPYATGDMLVVPKKSRKLGLLFPQIKHHTELWD